MFEIVFLFITVIYFMVGVLLLIFSGKKFKSTNESQKISIIIAARNEEDNIINCLESINAQNFPSENMEVIIVDDFSTDKTNKLISDFIADKPNFKVINPSKKMTEKPGKANALANGIEICSNEIVLTTDADCVANPNWAKSMASYFTNEKVGFVGGYTNQNSETPFFEMQSIDFMFLLTIASGTMNAKLPVSCIGNNMAFRKKVYVETGGFAKIPFSVTEDFALITNIDNLKKYDLIYPLDSKNIVTSKPLLKLKEIFWQKKRWSVGGMKMDFIGLTITGIAFLTNTLLILSPIFINSNVISLIFFKILTDYLFLYSTHKQLKLKITWKGFLAFELYFMLYILTMPFIITFSQKVKWKGREF